MYTHCFLLALPLSRQIHHVSGFNIAKKHLQKLSEKFTINLMASDYWKMIFPQKIGQLACWTHLASETVYIIQLRKPSRALEQFINICEIDLQVIQAQCENDNDKIEDHVEGGEEVRCHCNALLLCDRHTIVTRIQCLDNSQFFTMIFDITTTKLVNLKTMIWSFLNLRQFNPLKMCPEH